MKTLTECCANPECKQRICDLWSISFDRGDGKRFTEFFAASGREELFRMVLDNFPEAKDMAFGHLAGVVHFDPEWILSLKPLAFPEPAA